MAGASDRRSVSAGHFRSNDLLEARESARAGNKLLEFTQLGIAGARSAPATYIRQKKSITKHLTKTIIQPYKLNSAYTPPPLEKHWANSTCCDNDLRSDIIILSSITP